MSDSPPQTPWHALSVGDIFTRLGSRPAGLRTEEAAERLARFGPNRLPPAHRRSPLSRFLLQFHNVLIYVLLASAAVTVALGHWVDASVILGVVVVNALIGFLQEGKAEKALESLRSLLSLQAIVLRDGIRKPIQAEDLVPGDIVFLQAGDKVPADLRLLNVRELQADEAMLTGESLPVRKGAEAVAASVPLGDRLDMAFSGTIVTSGQGSGVVVATGQETELGRISAMLSQVQTLTTPLLRKMSAFARILTGAVLATAAATFVFGIWVRGYSAVEMFLAAVGLAVAAIPEGLPAIITITLAIGVQRMAGRQAIIRRLPAVETLGSVTVICSDKTGTLTRGEMTVQTIITAEGRFSVTGVGYDPHGAFLLGEKEVCPADYPILEELVRAGLLCNDASLAEEGESRGIRGDPTEGALLVLAEKMGFALHDSHENWPRDDVIPFESEHRFMATLHHDHGGRIFVALKGAPERLLDMCSMERRGSGDVLLDRQVWEVQTQVLGREGMRVLAIAGGEMSPGCKNLQYADVGGGMVFFGLLGLIDPPRPEAIESVRRCRQAGIRVAMITGDHLVTALAIARGMGIAEEEAGLSGADLERMGEEELREKMGKVSVFARAAPEHKLRLVKTLQALGEVVAMTGDGVNDAPALKRADVGVAMGIKGTEVAKEAAEVVLADDNFASIAHAVEEGRTVYDNIRKTILFILPTNLAEALVILTAIGMGTLLPITPVQILWVNMITAVTLGLALAFEPPEEDVMRRPPRDPREPILSGFLLWRLLYVSLVMLTGVFALFLWEREGGRSVQEARTVAVNTLVLFEAFYLPNSRYMYRTVLSVRGLLGNRILLGAQLLVILFQLLFTYAAPMQLLFETTNISASVWGRIVVTAASVFVLVEVEKLFSGWFLRTWRKQ